MESVTSHINHDHQSVHNHSTLNALGRAAKCFGRNVIKLTVAVPYLVYHALSIATEGVCGAGGAVVGAARGATVKLVRAIGANYNLCHKSTKPLLDYMEKDFHRGANIGWLPGQVIGVAGAAVSTAACIVQPVLLGIMGGLIGACSLIDPVAAYCQIKKTGHSSAEENSKHFLRDIRRECRDIHDTLYGDKPIPRCVKTD